MKSGGKKPTGKSLKVSLKLYGHKEMHGTVDKTRQFLVESLLQKIDIASFLQLKEFERFFSFCSSAYNLKILRNIEAF